MSLSLVWFTIRGLGVGLICAFIFEFISHLHLQSFKIIENEQKEDVDQSWGMNVEEVGSNDGQLFARIP